MKRSGPDSLTSWIIASACCFINMMMYGMARLSGVLFVASVPRFNVDREKASFPYTFASFMRNTSGPLVGFLGHRYGVRVVTTFGCILGAVGAGLCYLAESVDTITVLWGAVFGLGFGLGNILLPVSINQYFDKHRATASGISYSGACLGSFVLPPIVDVLINTYGLSGTFLFLSGFILNCVPAALLLKKPNFQIKSSNIYDSEESEKQSIVSGLKVKLYTVENDSQKPKDVVKNTKDSDTVTKPGSSNLTYDERMKRLSTQTLLSDYSIRMSTSEPLDVEQIIENSKGRRQVDPKVLEEETISLSSRNTDQDLNSEKDEVFEREIRSSSVQYEKPTAIINFKRNRSISSESAVSDKAGRFFVKRYKEAYYNYGYQTDADDYRLNAPSNLILEKNISKSAEFHFVDNNEVYLNCAYQESAGKLNIPSAQHKISPSNPNSFSKNLENCNLKMKKMFPNVPSKDVPKSKEKSCLGSFSIIYDPMFILIALTNAIYCFTFVCMITVIVDFARDLNVGVSNEKYVLMILSVGDLIGRLGLGWITDGGYMSTTGFAALCFACQGVMTAAIVWSNGFVTLLTLVGLYGLSEAGLIIIFPIIIAQYIDADKQTVAIPSSNFLSGPLCLAIAPLIGYFRDCIGAYDFIFYGIGILSFVCSLTWILAPCIAKCQRK